MKNLIIYLLTYFTLAVSFAQNTNERVLFVVDSVPVIKEPEKGFGTLSEDLIDHINILTNKSQIEATGFTDIDKIMYVFTKSYVQRSDSLKAIPTTHRMTRKNTTWYLNEKSIKPYSGPFKDYYLNGMLQGEGTLYNGKLKGKRIMYYVSGEVSTVMEYDNGFINGFERQYYQDGSLKQEGQLKNEQKIGVWKAFHPNGQLKAITPFDQNGKVNGQSINYYSTGEIKSSYTYVNGTYQKDKIADKFYKLYNEGQAAFKVGNFKSAIKKYSKCIELNPNSAEAYFARGTARMNLLEFPEAKVDFDKAIEIEPYYTHAYANRAFVIIRKYEFSNSRKIKGIEGIVISSNKKVKMPQEEKEQLCTDLNKAISLGDDSWMVLEAVKEHCIKPK